MLLLLGACSTQKKAIEVTVHDAYTNTAIKAQLSFGAKKTHSTSDDGHYVTSTWSPKDKLSISAPGYAPTTIDLATRPELTEPNALTVTLAAPLRPDTLQGTVRNTYTGEPIPGAHVAATEDISATTDAQGTYMLQQVPEAFKLTVSATLYEPTQHDLSRTTTMDLALRPNAIRGTVRDAHTEQGIPDITVSAGSLTAKTNAQGVYELRDVPETVHLTFSGIGYDEATQEISRTTTVDAQLRPNVVRGIVADKNSGQGISGVGVKSGALRTHTDMDGSYTLMSVPERADISFGKDGYHTITETLPIRSNLLNVTLRSDSIAGIIVDGTDGKPLQGATVIALPTISGTATAMTRTDAAGNYTLQPVPEGAYLRVLMPGYRAGEARVLEGNQPATIKLERFVAKALYIKAPVASSGLDTVKDYYDIIDRTELNAAVIDIKSDNLADVGFIYYKSEVPEIIAAETSADYMPIRGILAEAKRRNIYTIARIHVFAHDNALIAKHPDWYVQKDGKPWFADFGIAWLDTYDERVWDYNIKLAVEAAQLGFDEIQFDYIRFPSDGKLTGAVFKGPRDPKNNPEEMYDTIGRFMERAQHAINAAGAFFSVDVFGYVTWEPQPYIGQNLQIMGKYADYVYPMVYPSSFIFGEQGFANPAAHPYDIVDISMQRVNKQLVGEASRAKVRPWLQDFTLIWVPDRYIVRYGAKEVRAQIDAAEKNGVDGWALWDPDNDYTVTALRSP